MKRYDSYKDSGVEVIGVVPSHWKKSKFKFNHIESDQRVDNSWTEYQLLSLTKQGVIIRDIESGKGKFPESFETYKKVENGELIFCLYDIEETPRTVGLSNLKGMITGSYKIFRTIDVLPKFTYYTFLSIDDVKGLKPYYTGLRNVVRPETFKSLPFHYPPLSEQQKIVSFLDTKTSQIDSLIEKTQSKIELLKEKRTSLINEVVTKGLNPNVEMKDSGVEWIGEIPSHWEFLKIKRISNIKRGSSPRPIDDPKFFDDKGEYFWIRISDVTRSGKFLFQTGQKMSELGSSLSHKLNEDEIVMSISGSVGKVFITKTKCCIHDGFVTFENPKVDKDFLYYLLTNEELYSEDRRLGTQFNINSDIVGNKYIPQPPHSEQTEIVSYLDEHTHLIDKTISIEEKRIELLKEYRQSLISEVVTGKRKVVD